MREILFRGKRIDNGEWVEGWLVIKKDPILDVTYCFILAYGKGESYVTWYPVDPATVGQYTGLTDSTKWEQLTEKEQSDWLKSHTVDEWNGKQIFEGDIIKSWQGKILAVKFGQYRDDEECVYGNGWYLSGEYGTLSFDERWAGHEVIGNIHDNPELIKEEPT